MQWQGVKERERAETLIPAGMVAIYEFLKQHMSDQCLMHTSAETETHCTSMLSQQHMLIRHGRFSISLVK